MNPVWRDKYEAKPQSTPRLRPRSRSTAQFLATAFIGKIARKVRFFSSLLVQRARVRRNRAQGTPLSAGASPNTLWCADFKSLPLRRRGGEFKLGNGRYCYPLTVSDHASRYLLLCEAFDSTREAPVIEAFQQLFRDRGLPGAIRSDNGVPFASPNGLYNLSRLSVWWLRLGISIERIKPGHPQQNGRHERMHSP